MKWIPLFVLAGVAGLVVTLGSESKAQHLDELPSQTSYYPSGQLKCEFALVAGQKHGPSREFHPDGTLAAEGEYQDGQREGEWHFFAADGTLDRTRSGIYSAGRRVDAQG